MSIITFHFFCPFLSQLIQKNPPRLGCPPAERKDVRPAEKMIDRCVVHSLWETAGFRNRRNRYSNPTDPRALSAVDALCDISSISQLLIVQKCSKNPKSPSFITCCFDCFIKIARSCSGLFPLDWTSFLLFFIAVKPHKMCLGTPFCTMFQRHYTGRMTDDGEQMEPKTEP